MHFNRSVYRAPVSEAVPAEGSLLAEELACARKVKEVTRSKKQCQLQGYFSSSDPANECGAHGE